MVILVDATTVGAVVGAVVTVILALDGGAIAVVPTTRGSLEPTQADQESKITTGLLWLRATSKT